jgi:DNA-binding response OmpR family regulator
MAEILLIDDDESLRPLLQSALTERGHGVHCLDRADRALEVLAGGDINLIVVDEIMPGLHGSEFINVLRSQGNDTPVILVTGLATGALVEPMKLLGARVVAKPAGGSSEFLKDLLPAIEATLEREAEFAELIGRTVRLALKLGKTAAYVRWLLDCELRVQTSALVNHGPNRIQQILGADETGAQAEYLIRLQGDIWHLRFQDESGDYPRKGNQSLAWLHKLLAAPNKLFTVADLQGDPEHKLSAEERMGADYQTDDAGVRKIKERLEEIAETVEATGGSESLENEHAALMRQFGEAMRGKKMDSPLKKAFRNVCVQLGTLRDKKLALSMPRLASHLRATLKMEFPYLGYYPPPGASAWQN